MKELFVFKEEEMGARQQSYLHGLECLEKIVEKDADDCNVIFSLIVRLKDNIERQRIQGETKDIVSDRMEILNTANEITKRLLGVNFDEYCQSEKSLLVPIVGRSQEVPALIESTNAAPEISAQTTLVEGLPTVAQEATIFLASVKEYINNLQKSVRDAREVFKDSVYIDQERCEEALSALYVFDCSNFPEYNSSLYRAKIRLEYLSAQVRKLMDLCEICDDIDRPSRANRRKLQELIGIVDSLFYDIPQIQVLLNSVDSETGA